MQKKLQILLASQNQGKLRELQAILQDLTIQLITPADAGIHLDVAETGSTYAENAALKSKAYADICGCITLADDSGLEVDALNGAPGLYSARYAPDPKAMDADRRAYLLQNLVGHPRPWTARFHATIAITLPGGVTHFAEGVCEGEIILEERGNGGFGYDPIFYIPEAGLTMAELDEYEKNRISHRARALENAKDILLGLM
jgi:XTP/dITP diphosphohydrolase